MNHKRYFREAAERATWHPNFLHIYWGIPQVVTVSRRGAPARPALTPILKRIFGKEFAA